MSNRFVKYIADVMESQDKQAYFEIHQCRDCKKYVRHVYGEQYCRSCFRGDRHLPDFPSPERYYKGKIIEIGGYLFGYK